MDVSNITHINLVFIDAGEDYILNWEQRLHIAFDAAQGLNLSWVFAFWSCMYMCADEVQVLINYRIGVFT